jgi:hypothetical protein
MKRRPVGIFLLLLGVSAAVISCGESSPVAPRSPAIAPQADLVSNLLQRTGLIKCTPLPPASDAQVIGSGGGTLNIGPHKFVVPAGALNHPVLISAYAPSDEYNRVEFEPEGLQFQRSASLTMSYANCNLLGALLPKHIAYVDDDLNILYLLQSVDNLLTKKVTGNVDHFSDYVISW